MAKGRRYPIAAAFDFSEKKYKCQTCKDTGKVLVERYSEVARRLYGANNDAMILVEEPCPKCEAERAKRLFEVHAKQPDKKLREEPE